MQEIQAFTLLWTLMAPDKNFCFYEKGRKLAAERRLVSSTLP